MTQEAFSSFQFLGPAAFELKAQTAYQGDLVEGLRRSSLAPSASCESV